MNESAEKTRPPQSAQAREQLRLWLRLLACTTTIEQAIRMRLRKEFETTLPRFDVLATLSRAEDGLTMSELSRRLMVSNGNVTGLVDRMAEEGLVRRVPHPSDRRSSYVALSQKGRARFDEMADVHAGWIAMLFDGLDPAETRQLYSLLGRLKESAEEGMS